MFLKMLPFGFGRSCCESVSAQAAGATRAAGPFSFASCPARCLTIQSIETVSPQKETLQREKWVSLSQDAEFGSMDKKLVCGSPPPSSSWGLYRFIPKGPVKSWSPFSMPDSLPSAQVWGTLKVGREHKYCLLIFPSGGGLAFRSLCQSLWQREHLSLLSVQTSALLTGLTLL